MDLTDKRFLIAGATGVLGGLLARDMAAAGVKLALAGRDEAKLSELGEELSAATAALDFAHPDSAQQCVETAAQALGGLDGLVLATGAVAFGEAGEIGDDVVADLFAVNTLGPIKLIRAALGRIKTPGAIVGLTAVVADHPTAGLAGYSASKAALSAYLTALRRERRRDGMVVLDVRPQHMDTGFADRALAGAPSRLPEPGDHHAVAAQIIAALREDRRELAYDLERKELVAR